MAPSTMIRSATSGSLVLVALVVGLAVLAGTSVAQQKELDDLLFTGTKLDDQAKSVVRELAKGDCKKTIFDDKDPLGLIPCVGALRSFDAGNVGHDSGCCSSLELLDRYCFCSVDKNLARLGTGLSKMCGIGRHRCATAEEDKRKAEVLGSLGACGQLFRRMASGEPFTVDGATPCAQQIATCSAGCQKP